MVPWRFESAVIAVSIWSAQTLRETDKKTEIARRMRLDKLSSRLTNYATEKNLALRRF